ncbi:hypothetical protein [Actinosynnema sp. NPDC020468]|uniref:hypothetical protein n=1 Tax=Actinosynnema sp. NPDC020468 TaxID=3154488 RepID=UPI0033DEB60E
MPDPTAPDHRPASPAGPLDPAQTRHALTVLTRLAQRSPAAEHHLATFLAGDPEGLAVLAAEVATETGPPLDRVLAAVLRDHPLSTEVLISLWRTASGLEDLRLAVADAQPSTKDLPADLLADHAVLLARAGRAAQAREVAPRAVARARELPTDHRDPVAPRVLGVVSHAYRILGDDTTARALVAEAVELAGRRLAGEPDPLVANLLGVHASHLLAAGDPAGTRAACDRALAMWEQVLGNPDLDLDLVVSRLADAAPGVAESLHIAVGHPSPDLYEGPRFGTYRLNAVMADDGEAYVGVRRWPVPAALRSIAFDRYLRGVAALADDDPVGALADLTAAAAVHRELVHSGQTDLRQAHLLFALAVCERWLGRDTAATVTRALDLVRDKGDETPGRTLAEEACSCVGPDAPGRTGYLVRLLDLGVAHAPVDGGALLGDLLNEVHLAAIGLRAADRLADAVALHELVIDASAVLPVDAARRPALHSSVALANTLLRLEDSAGAVAVADQAAALLDHASDPATTAAVHHVHARALARSGDRAAAVRAHHRAIAAFLPLADTDPDTLVELVFDYAVLTAHDGRPAFAEDVGTAVTRLLDRAPALSDRSTGKLADLAFARVSELARTGDPRTGEAYRSFLGFAHAHPEPTAPARAALAWNVLMLFVDTGDLAAAAGAVADLADLVAMHPDVPGYAVEYGKCSGELLAARWNSGDRAGAREVALAADAVLRSADYLRVRQRDNGQPPEEFLRTLDLVQQVDDDG